MKNDNIFLKEDLDQIKNSNNLKKEKLFLRKNKELTIWEKIDFIYKTIKAEKRNYKIKFTLKIIMGIVIFYFIIFYIPSIPQKVVDNFTKEVWEGISNSIWNFIKPFIEDITLDILKDFKNSKEIETKDLEQINEILEKYPSVFDKIKE